MKTILHCKYLLACLIILVLCNSACTKFVAIDPPPTQVESVVIFQNDAAAVSAVTGLYGRMTGTNLLLTSGAMTLYPGLSSDEFYHTVTNADNDGFLNNTIPVDNGTGNYVRLWRAAYQHIYNANAILEGLARTTALTDSVRAQLQGEMLVVRSLQYFYLVNLYGAVPLITATDYRASQNQARTPVADIYRQLVTDLQQAKTLLASTYVSTNRARPNRFMAAALLARVYLYQKDWINAATEASGVIQNNQYALVPLLNNVFLPTSTETIWQLARDNGNTGEGNNFLPSAATIKPPYVITNNLLNAFETTDKRKASWLAKNTISGIDYYYPAKYKVRIETPVSEYYVVFRLAELYLIRSEARAMQNDLVSAKADLDVIRTRAGLTASTANTQMTLLVALEKERQTELFLEWGHRWLDIIRWGKADAVFGPLKGGNWQSTDIRYPIPLRELQTNPILEQNPGY